MLGNINESRAPKSTRANRVKEARDWRQRLDNTHLHLADPFDPKLPSHQCTGNGTGKIGQSVMYSKFSRRSYLFTFCELDSRRSHQAHQRARHERKSRD